MRMSLLGCLPRQLEHLGGRQKMINEATEQVQSCDLEGAQEELPDALLVFQQRPVGQRILSEGGKP